MRSAVSAPIIPAIDCCSTCPDITTPQLPGPPGPAGADGTNGTDGTNAFTQTTDSFVMPAISGPVTVEVADSTWVADGQALYVQNAGYLQVDAIPDATHLTLLNFGYPGNVSPATVVASGQTVSPAGLRGSAGAAGSTPTLNSISPTTTRGDLIVDNGAGSGSASDVRLAVGADGTRPMADSGQPTGLLYAKVDLADATQVTGVLPSANGGGSDRVAKAGDTMTGDLLISGNALAAKLKNTAASANRGLWGIKPSTVSLNFYSALDNEGGVVNWLTAFRGTLSAVDLISANVPFTAAANFRSVGFLSLTEYADSSLVNGNNNDVATFASSFVKLKAGPTGNFTITGIANPQDGQVILLFNDTGQSMTLAHESGLSVPTARIHSITGSSRVGVTIALLVYDTDALRWIDAVIF